MLLCGCMLRHKPVAPELPRGPTRDSLFRFDQARSDSAARSPDGALATFAASAAYLRAGAPVIYGRDAAARVVRATDVEPGAIMWEPLGGGVSSDLHSGYTYGVVARTQTEKANAMRFGRYIAYWERSRGAPWRIVAYVEVGSPPVPSSIEIPEAVRTPPAEPS